jgi:DNA (cytosine-5)-methyltransferase 1
MNTQAFDLTAEGREIKVLNLYACLGGNRYKWENCDVTAVELDPELARLYQLRFPNDKVIVGDAHEYLRKNYFKFDFIWSSPPCPSHSRARFWSSSNLETATEPVFPDMLLYEEILFLQHYYKGKFVVENVIPYYKPLIEAQKRGRHLYWTNIKLPKDLGEREIQIGAGEDEVTRLCEFHDYDFRQYKGEQRIDKIARNLVDYEAGLTIFQCAVGAVRSKALSQTNLFEAT